MQMYAYVYKYMFVYIIFKHVTLKSLRLGYFIVFSVETHQITPQIICTGHLAKQMWQ